MTEKTLEGEPCSSTILTSVMSSSLSLGSEIHQEGDAPWVKQTTTEIKIRHFYYNLKQKQSSTVKSERVQNFLI